MACKQKFGREEAKHYSKLGLRRKKKQKYRKGKGLDNKVRLKMKGHLKNVSIGFRSEKRTRDKINRLGKVKIESIEDLKKIKEGDIGVLAKMGNKKKIEIAKKAQELKISLVNLNPNKFLSKIEEERRKKKEERIKNIEKKKARDKKAKEKEKKKSEEEKKKEESKKEESLEKKAESEEKKEAEK
jgi:ribosomal protein L32E